MLAKQTRQQTSTSVNQRKSAKHTTTTAHQAATQNNHHHINKRNDEHEHLTNPHNAQTSNITSHQIKHTIIQSCYATYTHTNSECIHNSVREARTPITSHNTHNAKRATNIRSTPSHNQISNSSNETHHITTTATAHTTPTTNQSSRIHKPPIKQTPQYETSATKTSHRDIKCKNRLQQPHNAQSIIIAEHIQQRNQRTDSGVNTTQQQQSSATSPCIYNIKSSLRISNHSIYRIIGTTKQQRRTTQHQHNTQTTPWNPKQHNRTHIHNIDLNQINRQQPQHRQTPIITHHNYTYASHKHVTIRQHNKHTTSANP